MNKKDYQKPTMEVVEIQQQAQLLQVSGEVNATQVNATMNNEWGEEDI